MNLRFPRRAFALLTISLAALLAGGCRTAGGAFVTRGSPPALAPTQSLPKLADDDGKIIWQLRDPAREFDSRILKFFAAREAYWSYDTDTAVKLLRELRHEDFFTDENFHDLVLHCYEAADRWADTLPLYAEFGLTEDYAGRMKHAQFRAGLSPRQQSLAPGAPPVPITLGKGDLVLVEAMVNGVKARFMLDTGFSISWISEKLAHRAGVTPSSETISLRDVNGHSRDTPFAVLRDLRLGGLAISNQLVTVGHFLTLEWFVDGVIGWDALQYLDFTWDFPSLLMTLAEPAGPVVTAPHLSGRSGPSFTATASTGQSMLISFDSGAHGNARANASLFTNHGVLATKVPLATFRPRWFPTFTLGVHSLGLSWEKRTAPFSFWFDGCRFDFAFARLKEDDLRQDSMVILDGVTGNAAFLTGKLRLCGVRRLISFEPGRPVANAKVAATTAP